MKIVDFNIQGQGVGRDVEGKIVFVEGAVPGDDIVLDVVRDKKEYVFAKVKELVVASPDRVTPACRHFGVCGGCQIQHVSYAAQLAYKQRTVEQAIARIGGFAGVVVNAIVPADPVLHYRNKSQVPLGFDRDVVAGFYKVDSHTIVNMNECHIQPTDFTKIALAFRQFVKDKKWPVYDEHAHHGLIRHLIIRSSDYLKEILLGIVVNGKMLPSNEAFIAFIEELNEELEYKISSVALNYNTEKTNKIMGEKTESIIGSGFTTDRIGRYFFKVSLDTFLQIHPRQANNAYALLRERILPNCNTLLDAYCGVGTISINVADKAKRIIGIEVNKQAIKDAKRNAQNNDKQNIEFFCSQVEDYDLFQQDRPDVVIVDPPRKGLDRVVVDRLRELKPKQILYMSCDPATLARDLKLLAAEALYKIVDVTPFDFFPQTTHVESVVELRLS